MLDLFIVKPISYLGCFRAIPSLHEIDLGCLGVLGCLGFCARLPACFVGAPESAAVGY